ncbi:MAG TPA: hypothetical protein VEN79_18585 [Terriglobia bacterium]|nr:hypothetical protein [Terriglobia bacterium]
MLEMQLRQAATVLLESAIRIAPPDTVDWGRAMQSELNYVKGGWAAVMWALGGASVLAKQALTSLLIPGRGGRGIVPDGGIFAKSATLRSAALALGGAFVLTGLLFFAAPPFRQAFEVALRPWLQLYRFASGNLEPGFEALAKRAETQQDPEGLAFCAVRLQDPEKSARLVEQAVRLDPNLIWVYAIVAMRHPGLPQARQWLDHLVHWDPQNAFFYLLSAESIERAQYQRGEWRPQTEEQKQAWQTAMAAAFRCSKFDDYSDRVTALNRWVVPHYAFYDPYEVDSRAEINTPLFIFDNSERYAKSLLRGGDEMEKRGNRSGARDKYWVVARFGQRLDSQGHTGFEHLTGTGLQAMAYQRLQASSESEGHPQESALFGYLAAKFDVVSGQHPGFPRESAFGRKTAERNAAVVEISGLMILVSFAFVVIATAILIAGSRRGAGAAAQRAKPVATIVILASAVGLLFSSVTLYLTYRPYWYIFQTAIQNGGMVETRDLQEFLSSTHLIPGFSPRGYIVFLNALLYSGSPSFLFYVWAGVTLLGVIGLTLILLRHVLGRPHAHAP